MLARCPTDSEIYAECYETTGLRLTDGGMDSTVSTTAGAAVRCFRRGAVGFAATHDLGPGGLARAVAAAAAAADAVPSQGAVLPADSRATTAFSAGQRLTAASQADLKSVLEAVRTELGGTRSGSCTPVTLTAELGRRRTAVCNGTGLARWFEEAYVRIGATALVPGPRGQGLGQASWWGRDLGDLPVTELAGRVTTDGRVRLAAAGRRLRGEPLLVTAPVAARLLAHCTGLFASGDAPESAHGLSPAVTLDDDPLAADVVGAAPFDGEGVVTTSKTLVDQGRPARGLGDYQTSRRTGDPSAAGNVQRSAYTQWPAVGVSVLTLRPGVDPPKALTAGAEGGYLVQGVRGLSAGDGRIGAEFLAVPLRSGAAAGPPVRLPVTTTPAGLLGSVTHVGCSLYRHGAIGAPDLLLDGARLVAPNRHSASDHEGERS
ncbi:hypothetical protein AQI88_08335 [Streptomyces cellostaticus]|uniref:TldD/PmbA family protein n=1 Tax=Streptomyces cellostaticus TaxID=67285 RepID=A0A101NPY0_9ACTN|nr:hypothetical protein AQI88_08335 [Streptomyces cellostaticus]